MQYGDFECPYTVAAYPAVRDLQSEFGERLRVAFRPFPLFDIHPHALHAAQAAECAALQGAFWPMHDRLFEHPGALGDAHLVEHAQAIGLDVQRFLRDMAGGACLGRVREHLSSGAQSGVRGTPTFFINGELHSHREGLWDERALRAALRESLANGGGA